MKKTECVENGELPLPLLHLLLLLRGGDVNREKEKNTKAAPDKEKAKGHSGYTERTRPTTTRRRRRRPKKRKRRTPMMPGKT